MAHEWMRNFVENEKRRGRLFPLKSTITIFWDITSCSPLKVNRLGGTYRRHFQGDRMSQAKKQLESRWQAEPSLPPAFMLVSCSVYSMTLTKEAICSSETSIDFKRATWCYIPEDSTLHNQHCENLKSYIYFPYSESVG
jgi:hypothetical protein